MEKSLNENLKFRKDEKGRLLDQFNVIWEAGQSETPKKTIIADTGTGKQRIVRFFTFHKLPGTVMNGQEVYKKLERFIKDTLYSSGLTTDDNYPPVIHDNKEKTVITIVAKAVGTRMDIYSGMKHGQKTVTNVKGLKIRGEKTDNISTLLPNK